MRTLRLILEIILLAYSDFRVYLRGLRQEADEKEIEAIKSDPAGHFANKFGRVQSDKPSITDVPDASEADKTNAEHDSK